MYLFKSVALPMKDASSSYAHMDGNRFLYNFGHVLAVKYQLLINVINTFFCTDTADLLSYVQSQHDYTQTHVMWLVFLSHIYIGLYVVIYLFRCGTMKCLYLYILYILIILCKQIYCLFIKLYKQSHFS